MGPRLALRDRGARCSLLAVGIVYSVSNSDDTPTATATAAPTSSETTDPDATASDTPAEEAPATETPVEPTEEPTDDATDTSTPVRVLNSTGIAGLAASAASDLEAEGWTDITAATYEGTPVDDSVVYYKTTDDQAEATEVARILGIPTVYEAPSLVGPVSAVLAGDYGQ